MIRHLTSLVPVIAVVAGCSARAGTSGHTVSTLENPEDVSSTQDDPSLSRSRPQHGPPGGERLLAVALRELELSTSQRTTIEDALTTAESASHSERPSALLAALAASVRAGQVDATDISSKFAGLHDDQKAGARAAAVAIQILHDVLTPTQRAALVDKMTTRMGGPPPGSMPPARGHGPLGSLLATLDLTDAQTSALDDAFAAHPLPFSADEMKVQLAAMHAEMISRLQTFTSASFSATALAEPPTPADMLRGEEPAQRMATEIALVTSVLQPAQRQKLAALLGRGGPFGKPPEGSCDDSL
jgi:Spy/CpxP family protein refolding chaperone